MELICPSCGSTDLEHDGDCEGVVYYDCMSCGSQLLLTKEELDEMFPDPPYWEEQAEEDKRK